MLCHLQQKIKKGGPMSLICIACGNREFFDCGVETVMELALSSQGLLIQPASMDDWKYAEDSIRDQVSDNVFSTLKMDAGELTRGDCFNPYLRCAVCYSESVCRPFSDWHPRRPTSDLDKEMLDNRQALTQLRKARKSNENNLPVLWQP